MSNANRPSRPAPHPDWDPVAARDEFERKFRRSKTNPSTVWREYDVYLVSVFRHGGRYRWCIAYGEEKRFSPWAGYATKAEAMDALWDALGGNEE